MKRKDGYWIDKNGNMWRVEFYTRAVAVRLSKSLVSCRNCLECSDCSFCDFCENCTKCAFCWKCKGCTSCEFSRTLNNCHRVYYCRSCKNTGIAATSSGLVDCCQVAFARNIKNGKLAKSIYHTVIEGHGVELVKFEDNSCCCSYDTCKGLTVRQLMKKLNKLSYDKLSEIRSLQDIFYGIGEG